MSFESSAGGLSLQRRVLARALVGGRHVHVVRHVVEQLLHFVLDVFEVHGVRTVPRHVERRRCVVAVVVVFDGAAFGRTRTLSFPVQAFRSRGILAHAAGFLSRETLAYAADFRSRETAVFPAGFRSRGTAGVRRRQNGRRHQRARDPGHAPDGGHPEWLRRGRHFGFFHDGFRGRGAQRRVHDVAVIVSGEVGRFAGLLQERGERVRLIEVRKRRL